jgi:hypothetical protein
MHPTRAGAPSKFRFPKFCPRRRDARYGALWTAGSRGYCELPRHHARAVQLTTADALAVQGGEASEGARRECWPPAATGCRAARVWMRKRTRSSSSAAKPKASRSPSPSAAAATAVPAPSLLTLLGFKPHVTFSIIGVLGLQLAFFFGGLSYVEFVVCGMRDNVDSMIDHPFNWALSANAYAQAQEDAAPDGRSLLVTSLLMADTLFVGSCAIVAMYLILCSDDLTVIAAMLCNHSIRALCFLLVELPKPERIIWRSPGVCARARPLAFLSASLCVSVRLCQASLTRRTTISSPVTSDFRS